MTKPLQILSSTTPTSDDPTQRRLPPLLRRAWFSLNQAFRRRIAHLGVTPDQYTTLRWLCEHEPKGLTQRELTELMASDPNTIAVMLARMEEWDWISRKPDRSDRRAKRIRPLAKGRRLHDRARSIADDLQADVMGAIPRNRREPFLETLEAVADACRNELEGS